MNAMQAVIKLERLKDEVQALNLAIKVMESKNSDSYYIRIVNEIKTIKFNNQKELEDVLKEIELPKQF
jgi:hypothetical protein